MILAQFLSGLAGVARHIKNVIGNLEGQPERCGIAGQRRTVSPGEDRPGFGSEGYQRAGFFRLEAG